jgi:magnesium chelatase accessory protein
VTASTLVSRASDSSRLDWDRDGRGWPLREASRFVRAGGLRWHVQVLGHGPVVLLLHGTGAATHSWRGIAPLLARRFTVVAPDLPGHGFSDPLPKARQSLAGMADALASLAGELEVEPAIGVGHSAGAALAMRAALDGPLVLGRIVSLNGALLPFPGMAGVLFPSLARMFGRNSLVPRLFAWRARDRSAVEHLIASTGSVLDPTGVELYARLVSNPGHVAGALAMMANWDLDALHRDLPRLTTPVHLIAGERDRTVPAAAAQQVQRLFSRASVEVLPGLGHLAHEEAPEVVAQSIFRAA